MLNIANYYEQIVIEHLDKITENADFPVSQGFLEDVACIALNKLPANYIRYHVDKGSSLSDVDYLEIHAKVDKVIAEAIEQVRRRPHDLREG